MNLTKTCSTCKKELSLFEFWKRSAHKDGLMYTCKKCTYEKDKKSRIKHRAARNAYLKEWNLRNKEKAKQNSLHSYWNHREQRLKKSKELYRALKIEIFAAYGNKCACCGENRFEFLSVDHINGGGCKHRRALGAKSVFYLIKREGFPKDKYRLLCYNCNMAIGHQGYCPHEKEREAKLS